MLEGQNLIEIGAYKINNSMYRFRDFTFQNHTNLIRLMGFEDGPYNGFKVCFKGKYHSTIYTEIELNELVNNKYK